MTDSISLSKTTLKIYIIGFALAVFYFTMLMVATLELRTDMAELRHDVHGLTTAVAYLRTRNTTTANQ
jgi:hypothetical protein